MNRQPSLRARLVLLLGGVTGVLVLLCAVLCWELLVRGHRERLDTQLADLALGGSRREHGAGHYRRLEESLALVQGEEAGEFILRVTNAAGDVIHQSGAWPADLDVGSLPVAGHLGARPAPPPAWVQRPAEAPLLAVREPKPGDAEAGGRHWRIVATGNETRLLWLGVDTSSFDAGLARERRAFLLVALGGLALALVAAWWLVGRALAPVEKLCRSIEGIGAENLGARIESAGLYREFAGLAASFNNLLARLEGSFRQARRFTADASHELRTPLALLHAQLEQDLQRAPDGSAWQEASARMLADVDRLRDSTDKLLLLAQADAGRLLVHSEAVDLSCLCLEVAEDVRLLGAAERLLAEIEPDVRVRGDTALLERVLQNLAANAVRHSGPDGAIVLRLVVAGGRARVEFENTGDGIAEADRERLFERFHRGDAARSRDSGGAGLGLALGREIARAHGGELSLASALPVRFVLELPLGPS